MPMFFAEGVVDALYFGIIRYLIYKVWCVGIRRGKSGQASVQMTL